MKKNVVLVIFIFLILSCKKSNKNHSAAIVTEKVIKDTILTNNENKKVEVKDTLTSIFDFKKILQTIKSVKNTKDKHKDWMFNRARTLRSSLEIEYDEFKVKSTSYTYKDSCVLYLHNISHTNNSIPIKPFIEKLQGKRTEGYTSERILIFAMKNDKEANFIDIPANWNHVELKEELLDTLYSKINSDVIICNRTKPCEYKDLRK